MSIKISLLNKSLVILASKWLNSLEKDFSFHNKNTELLAIWTILFMIITGLFIIAIKNNIFVMFFLLILSIVIMLIGTLAAAYYLHSLKYHKKNRFLPKTHNLLNKSFKLRTGLKFIKLPNVKRLLEFKLNFKLTS